MRRLAALACLVLAAFAAFAASLVPTCAASAQDAGPSIEERRAIVRALPPDEKERLRAALTRFRGLPREEQEALRAKARTVGPERLGGLAGRDVAALRSRHDRMKAEIDALMAVITPEVLAQFTPEEREHFRAEATRGFQRHIRRRLLEVSGRRPDDQFERLPPEERRAAYTSALARLEEQEMARLPEERANEIRNLPPKERARERQRLVAEWRRGETLVFAKVFVGARIERWKQLTPEQRSRELERWRRRSRWFEAQRVLREEIGLREESLVRLAELPPHAAARVLHEVRVTDEWEAERRRLHLQQLVDELHGRAAIDGAPVPPLAPRTRGRSNRPPREGAAPGVPAPPR